MAKANRNGDSVPASELLKALNTLKLYNCNDDNDLSFGEHSFRAPHKSQKAMNFQIYMEKQTDKSKHNRTTTTQKSVSPLKDMTRSFAKTSELSNNKRKSMTPLGRDSVNKLLTNKKAQQQRQVKQKQVDKQNREKNVDKSVSNIQIGKSSKVSQNSKKILDQRQKKGNAYVPIQMRAECLLKERQAKLAKLQKQKEIQKMIQEKECTFKPRISKSYVKKNEKPEKQRKQEKPQPLQPKTIQEHTSNVETIEEEPHESRLCMQTKAQQPKEEQPKLMAKEQKSERIGFKKYKNQKFNSLLDLIH